MDDNFKTQLGKMQEIAKNMFKERDNISSSLMSTINSDFEKEVNNIRNNKSLTKKGKEEAEERLLANKKLFKNMNSSFLEKKKSGDIEGMHELIAQLKKVI